MAFCVILTIVIYVNVYVNIYVCLYRSMSILAVLVTRFPLYPVFHSDAVLELRLAR